MLVAQKTYYMASVGIPGGATISVGIQQVDPEPAVLFVRCDAVIEKERIFSTVLLSEEESEDALKELRALKLFEVSPRVSLGGGRTDDSDLTLNFHFAEADDPTNPIWFCFYATRFAQKGKPDVQMELSGTPTWGKDLLNTQSKCYSLGVFYDQTNGITKSHYLAFDPRYLDDFIQDLAEARAALAKFEGF